MSQNPVPLVFDHIGRVDVSEGKNAPCFATIPRPLTERPVPYPRIRDFVRRHA